MQPLRELTFESLDAAAGEARNLLESGYEQRGQWTLGQICRHLCLVQDPSVDGYPKWFSLFAFLRPVMRRFLLPKLHNGNPPRGIPTAPNFVPAGDLEDAAEVERFMASVKRFQEYTGNYAPHPAFGRMDPASLERLHASHAAHHLRFLQPKSE